MPETCPVCDSPHETYGGVAMHMVKMSDEEHAQWDTKDGALEYLAENGLIGVGSSGEGHVVDTSEGDTSEPPEPDTSEPTAADGGNPLIGEADPEEPAGDSAGDSEQCCNDPNLSPADGTAYRLESGDVVRGDEGDQYCSNCGAIVEADGEVLR